MEILFERLQNAGCEWVIHLIDDKDEMDVTIETCGDKSIKITDFKRDDRRTITRPDLVESGIFLMKKYVGI